MRSPDRRRPFSARRRSRSPWSPQRRRRTSFRDRDRKRSPSLPRHRRRRSRSPRPRRDSWRNSRSKSPAYRRKSPQPVVQQEAESTVKEERRSSLSPVATQRYPASFAAESRSLSPPAKTEATSRTADYDSLEICTSVSAKKHHDQTSISFDSRFTEECDNPLSFNPKENISVGIDRNIPGNEPAVVGGQLFPEQVLITRRRGEGEVPLHKRDEFLGPQDDDLSERRVIRVSKVEAAAGLGGRDNFEVRRNVDGDERRRGKRFTSEVELHGDRDERVRVDRKPLIYATGFGDRDERMVVDRTEGSLSHRDEDLRSARGFSDRSPRRAHDLRNNLSKKRKDDAPFDARQRLSRRHESSNEGRLRDDSTRSRGKAKEEEELPDFSLRPGKGVADEWKARPDMIPKGSQYFEHDNRGEHDYWERRAGRGGRGRGGRFSSSYRGRGSSFRGRTGSFRDSKKEDTQWKHDKFKELEEEKPSSTTK